jgi:hypothetical protein
MSNAHRYQESEQTEGFSKHRVNEQQTEVGVSKKTQPERIEIESILERMHSRNEQSQRARHTSSDTHTHTHTHTHQREREFKRVQESSRVQEREFKSSRERNSHLLQYLPKHKIP